MLKKLTCHLVFRVLKTVPRRGTANTKAWYREYQSVVLRIPRRGTVNTKAWYYEYHAVVLLVPKRLITVVLKSVTIPNGLDCRDK